MSSGCAIAAFLLPIVTPWLVLQANTMKVRQPVAGVLPFKTASWPGRHPKTMIFSDDSQTGPLRCDGTARVDLTGDLHVSSRADLLGTTEAYVHGYHWTIGTTLATDANTTIFLQAGQVTAGQRIIGGRLRGPGTINGMQFGAMGQLNPGEAGQPGTLTVDGDLELQAGCVCTFQLGAQSNDQLVVTGHAVLAGVLAVSLLDGFVPELGQGFDIITFGTSAGAFDNTEVVIGGIVLTIDYSYPGKVRLVRTV